MQPKQRKIMKTEHVPTAKLVTVETAAEMLSISRSQVYSLLRAGRLESVKIGRSRRFVVSALNTYVEGLQNAA